MSEAPRRRAFSAEKYLKPADQQPAPGASNLRSNLRQRLSDRAAAEQSTDLATVLSAIHDLKRDMIKGMLRQRPVQGETGAPVMDEAMAQDVRIEIAQMVRTIARAKTEIAAIKNPHAQQRDQIESASVELDEIVAATEDATNRILEANETLQGILDDIAGLYPDDPDLQVKVDEGGSQIIAVLEACNFQDITGQRITKVVRTLRFIEDRILAMISIWGAEAFSDLPLDEGEDETDEFDVAMEGPQRGNEGISQDEIDALFD